MTSQPIATSTTDTFSTPASHAFEHDEILASTSTAGPSSMGDAVAETSIEEAFEVEGTIAKILEGGYKTIGLQFPDELLPSSVYVFRAIQKAVMSSGAQCYVLADSTYGSCCPDVLSCSHLPADFLVHYGHACLTPTDALPVHYVFPRRSLDVKKALESLLEASATDLGDGEKKGVVLVWEVAFDWLADELVETFSAGVQNPISFATIQRPPTSSPAAKDQSLSDKAREKAPALRSILPPPGAELADCVLWYIGEEGRALMNLQMQHSGNPLYSYSPSTNQTTPQHPKSSRLLQRRLFALHSALSADVFGLVVGNVGLASSKPLLDQLRKDLKKARKKCYTLSVGRLNPAKLANFAEIECFVLVGCNEGGVVDSKDFYRPIITPWELTLALQGQDHVWDSSQWTLDLTSVLKAAQDREISHASDIATPNGEKKEEEELEFSLVTGAYRTRKTYGSGEETPLGLEGIKDLTLRNQDFTLAKLESAGSNYLSSRHFQGLDPRYGMDEPSTLEEGRTGIARGYTEEK